ncbi:MAG: YdeI/OmpD-associated family protein [Bacteroidota bacterium]
MIRFKAILQRFGKQGEKTGWTYIAIPSHLAQKLKPGNKKSFRVKGRLDNFPISRAALLPMGEGDFILPVNGTMRKGLRKQKGDTVTVSLEADDTGYRMDADFLTCLEDEPKALAFFRSLSPGHQNYFSKWIESAKTEVTKAGRIAKAVNGLSMGFDFGQMLRYYKAKKDQL